MNNALNTLDQGLIGDFSYALLFGAKVITSFVQSFVFVVIVDMVPCSLVWNTYVKSFDF